jgi:P-type E1-E2 ATPase
LNPATAICPLIFVVSVSMAREAYEDYFRNKADKKANSTKTEVLRGKKWEQVTASEVVVGDIVKVKNEETFPADLILIASSSLEGVCYINTSSMDGEKNLKKRLVPTECD